LNKNDWGQANQIFSTAIVANLYLVLLQLPFFALGLWKLDALIEFPPERSTDFRILVACNILVYLSAVVLSVVRTPIHAANRIDIGLKLEVVGQVVRLSALYLLITRIGPRLWIIGVVDLVLASLGLVGSIFISRKVARNLVFRRCHISWKWVKPIMSMAGWSIVATLGQILFQKTDVWIVNRFVDAKMAGVCAALLVWPNFVQQIAKNISALIMPVIMIDFAQERFERIRSMMLIVSRLFCIMAAFICGLIMVFGGWLLELWMGEGYRQYNIFLVLMLIHFPLTLVREAIWGIFPAFNKMHYLGISNLVSGSMNIALSLLAVRLGYGLEGVIVATGISLVVQRTLFLSIFAVRLLEIAWRRLFKCYLPGLLVVGLFSVQWICFDNAYIMQVGVAALGLASLFALEVLVREKESQAALSAIVMGLVRK
jgi:O-antigen/teichoic acid export membrane protein